METEMPETKLVQMLSPLAGNGAECAWVLWLTPYVVVTGEIWDSAEDTA